MGRGAETLDGGVGMSWEAEGGGPGALVGSWSLPAPPMIPPFPPQGDPGVRPGGRVPPLPPGVRPHRRWPHLQWLGTALILVPCLGTAVGRL